MFRQTIKVVRNLYRDFAGFDMSYEDFEKLCIEEWIVIFIIMLTGSKGKKKVNIVFVIKANIFSLNRYQKHPLSKIMYVNKRVYSVRNEEDMRELEKLAELKSKVTQVLLDEKFGKKGFENDAKKIF